MFSCHLEFLRQRKIEERNILPARKRNQRQKRLGGGLEFNSLPTSIQHCGTINYSYMYYIEVSRFCNKTPVLQAS